MGKIWNKILILILFLSVSCQSAPTQKSAYRVALENYLQQDLYAFSTITDIELKSPLSKIRFLPDGHIAWSINYIDLFPAITASENKKWRLENDELIIRTEYREHRGIPILSKKIHETFTHESLVPDKICIPTRNTIFGWKFNEADTQDRFIMFFTTNPEGLKKECLDLFVKGDAIRLKELTKKFGKTFAKMILEGKFAIGMTKEMVLASIGEPYQRNRTVTKLGTSEQWVYGNSGPYLYFNGDKLDSFQD